jgi:hypothetical protein
VLSDAAIRLEPFFGGHTVSVEAGNALADAARWVADRLAREPGRAGRKFTGIEGFADVVIGAEFQGFYSVGLLFQCHEHDDWHIRLVAYPARKIYSVLVLKHHVKNHEMVAAVEPGAFRAPGAS